ncbi:ANTAR domain-containing protein [Streptomyces sp. NPDC008150]|uniref:ANTAR domain-containing protein n=1 Tax=Streptomyces sp. NPDC008150 TaxID=3364816 RepID=UPI0036E6A7CA
MTFFALSTNPLRLDSTSDLAREIERLRTENAQLRRAVDSHALADQAIGVLVALARVTTEDGWNVLREVSQRTNTKLRTVAENVLAFARDGRLDERLRTELDAALRRRVPEGPPGP